MRFVLLVIIELIPGIAFAGGPSPIPPLPCNAANGVACLNSSAVVQQAQLPISWASATTTITAAQAGLMQPNVCTVASASTMDIGASPACTAGSMVIVTGVTNINSLGNSAPAGTWYDLIFQSQLKLFQNLPTFNLNSSQVQTSWPTTGNFPGNTTTMHCAVVSQTSGVDDWDCVVTSSPNIQLSPSVGNVEMAAVNVFGTFAPYGGVYAAADGNTALVGASQPTLIADCAGHIGQPATATVCLTYPQGTSTASTISGTTLTLGGTVAGNWSPQYQVISGAGITGLPQITALLSGTAGTSGATYTISVSQGTISAESISTIPTTAAFVSATRTPTLTSCGSGAAIVGTDQAGTITMGTGTVTACTATYQQAFVAAPNACLITPQSSASASAGAYISSVSTTAFTISASSLTGDKFSYWCF